VHVLVVLQNRCNGVALAQTGRTPIVREAIRALLELGEVDHRACLGEDHGGFAGVDVFADLHHVTLRFVGVTGTNLVDV
jgi:hypothetical protein